MLEDEVALELGIVEQNMANLEVDASSDDEEGGDGPASCITSSMTEAQVRASLESVRSYLYANGKDGEYRETHHLLSETVHSFTYETQVKSAGPRRGGSAGNSPRYVEEVVALSVRGMSATRRIVCLCLNGAPL